MVVTMVIDSTNPYLIIAKTKEYYALVYVKATERHFEAVRYDGTHTQLHLEDEDHKFFDTKEEAIDQIDKWCAEAMLRFKLDITHFGATACKI